MHRILLAALILLAPLARAADDPPVQVEVAEALMELRTGPGRGYPVFYVAERGETVQILKQRTAWFLVRTAREREGWVSREQIEATLMADGVQENLRQAVLKDFQRQRWDAGFGAGLFDGAPVVSFRGGYHFAEELLAEISLSQVSGTYSGSQLYSAGLSIQHPLGERWVPSFGLGIGRFDIRNRASLVGTTDSRSATALGVGIGLRYYLRRNFLLRADYRQYQVLTRAENNDRFDEQLVGFSFFF